ncbi:MAG: hypothetical protein ACI9GH_000426 [Candidatus Paceibacteria bacterium]
MPYNTFMTSNSKIFLFLGILIVVIPFLGIPQNFKNIILFIVGIILVILYLSSKKGASPDYDEESVYVENDGVEEVEEEIEASPVTKPELVKEVVEDVEEEVEEDVEEDKTEDEHANKFDKYFVDE